MEEKNKRKGIIYLSIGVITLIALIAGATYAYFQAVTGNTATANLNATSGSTDNLTFTIEDLNVGTNKIDDQDNTNKDIIINANQENFKEKGKSIGDGITGKAILVANNTTNITDPYSYYVYVNITDNDLKYSSYTKEGEEPKVYKTEEEKAGAELTGYTAVPELVMIVKKNGEEYTGEIKGLTKTTIITEEGTEAKGYDITEKSGAILISEETIQVTAEDKEHTKTDEWEISIVLVNLSTDQELNTGKKVTGEVIIQKDELIQAKLLADANKPGEEETLLYHNGTINVGGQIMDAEDYSYRYAGASEDVHNYVCFGGDCSNKPEETEKYANLYRIIGMFPTEETKDSLNKEYQLKLIKADATTEDETGGTAVGACGGKYTISLKSDYKGDQVNYFPKMESYYWNKEQNSTGDSSNDWGKSNLNTENLNKTYLSYIQGKDNEKWYNMIEDHTWTTAGNIDANIRTQNAKTTYDNEIKESVVGDALASAVPIYLARVGLMYVSDYMYGATKESWTTTGDNYISTSANNWLWMGLTEWTITRQDDSSYRAFFVCEGGYVCSNRVYSVNGYALAIRPVLYLKSDVKISTGSGTGDDPYILSLNDGQF